jgi:hypothetical protein
MLQLFHLDIAKVDQNVAVVIHVCFKCFILFSRLMFASVSSGCYICFHTYEVFFTSVSYTCFEYFSCFVCMLQVFHLDVLKVDLVLQLVFQTHVLCVSSTFRRML